MEPAATSAPIVTDERPCLRCGYSLRTLDRGGVCPECGTPVELSLRGNALVHSAPEYLAKLYFGALVAELTVVLALIAVVVGIIGLSSSTNLPAAGAIAVSLSLVPLVFAAGTLSGWWLLSAPDPAFIGADSGDRSRRVLRIALIAVVAVTLVWIGLRGWFGLWAGSLSRAPTGFRGFIVGLGSLSVVAVWTAVLIASMYYLRSLSPRLEEAKVRSSALVVVRCAVIAAAMILTPVVGTMAGYTRSLSNALVIGSCVGMLLVVITFILYGNLVHLVRVKLGTIRAEARKSAGPEMGGTR